MGLMPDWLRREMNETFGAKFWLHTGSRAWVCNSVSSDYDICFMASDRPKAEAWENTRRSDHRIVQDSVESHYNAGWKVSCRRPDSGPSTDDLWVKINFIPLHPNQLMAWATATEQMRSYDKMEIILRQKRIHAFQTLSSMAEFLISDHELSMEQIRHRISMGDGLNVPSLYRREPREGEIL